MRTLYISRWFGKKKKKQEKKLNGGIHNTYQRGDTWKWHNKYEMLFHERKHPHARTNCTWSEPLHSNFLTRIYNIFLKASWKSLQATPFPQLSNGIQTTQLIPTSPPPLNINIIPKVPEILRPKTPLSHYHREIFKQFHSHAFFLSSPYYYIRILKKNQRRTHLFFIFVYFFLFSLLVLGCTKAQEHRDVWSDENGDDNGNAL